ncbi:MAG TPA: hypothetical protein VHX43_12175 [Xanthobacteraceae bacterium]|jgi:hypothetical protein|nr:hypothetical protein [Xanthobacteraceae bacterium]
MVAGYGVVAFGLFAVFIFSYQAQFARKYGYTDRNSGVWVSPTDQRAIGIYVRNKRVAGTFLADFSFYLAYGSFYLRKH